MIFHRFNKMWKLTQAEIFPNICLDYFIGKVWRRLKIRWVSKQNFHITQRNLNTEIIPNTAIIFLQIFQHFNLIVKCKVKFLKYNGKVIFSKINLLISRSLSFMKPAALLLNRQNTKWKLHSGWFKRKVYSVGNGLQGS